MPNPVNGGSYMATKSPNQAPSDGIAWPSEYAVSKIVPEGSAYDPVEGAKFNHILDRAAVFFLSLTDASGDPIPVIFRPWFEHSGPGFWWGRTQRSEDKTKDVSDFVKLWRYTVSYLQSKGVYNLLYAYAPNSVSWNWPGGTVWEEYPGDDCIDIIGLSLYYMPDKLVAGSGLFDHLDEVTEKAREKGKIPALCEFGMAYRSTNHDYSGRYQKFLDLLLEKPERGHIAYLLTWANWQNGDDRYIPVAALGDDTNDFVRFCADERILLEKDFAALRKK
jgi:mannan endo-1,4-beta-mannosidase